MPAVISFIGAKGGTLKTSSVSAISHVISQTGLRVVMYDLDPQGDLTTRSGFQRVLDPFVSEPVPVQYEGERKLPLWLFRTGRTMEQATWEEISAHLDRMEDLQPDVVILDTPPALGVITAAAAERSAMIWIGAYVGVESVERAQDVIAFAREVAPNAIFRILLTHVNAQTNLFRWAVDQCDQLYPNLRSKTFIPFEAAGAESALFRRPVTVSAPRSRSALAYCDVAADILRRLQIEVQRPEAAGAL